MSGTRVRVRDCTCPGTPHEGHFVQLAETMPFRAGYLVERILVKSFGRDVDEVQAEITLTFIRHGAVDWDLCDDEGAARPFDVDALLADFTLARPVAIAIEALGWDSQVLDPLLEAVPPKTSRAGRTDGSTSPARRRTTKRSA